MSYAFIHDVPANELIYRRIRAGLGATTPKGLVAHLVLTREGGLRYIDVWETEADWTRFREDILEPVVDGVLAEFGIPHDHALVQFEEIDVIDAWVAPSAEAAMLS